MSSPSRQAEAIAQLTEVTGGGCTGEAARDMLESVDWDVQRAAELIFDGAAPPPRRPARMQQFEVEDPPYATPKASPVPSSSIARALAFPFRILLYPLRALAAILLPRPAYAALASTLARLSPAAIFLGVSHLLFGPPTPRRDLLRQLEEDTGAIPYSRWLSGGDNATTSGAEAGPGPATAQRRGARSQPPSGSVLPDFQPVPYDALLAQALTEARVACIILISSEHDDVPAFIRSTLTDPAFVKALHDNNVLTWIGDARMRDGWQAAQKLNVTTYPSVLFLAPQPAARGAPTLRILSRHAGAAATTPTALPTYITTTLIPRVSTYLEQLRTNPASAGQPAAHAELAAARRIRAEQDAAFAASAARDRERIVNAMNAEREAAERAQAEAAAAAAAEEEARRQTAERAAWRAWSRREVAGRSTGGGLRVAFRLPSGARAVQTFDAKDTLTGLFSYIDAQLLEEDGSQDSNASTASLPSPSSREEAEKAFDAYLATHPAHFRFTMAVAYPRAPIAWAPGVVLGDVRELAGGAQIVVERVSEKRSGRSSGETSRASLAGGQKSAAGSRVSLDSSRNGMPVNGASNADDDEYLTESDEE
ncbi:hypothetical protein EV121DRAFT_203021 [Schizophyllum commune]